MRGLLCTLLLAPGIALASPYKCMVGGQSTYSQFPCGADAQQVPNRLSGVQDAPALEQAASTTPAVPDQPDAGSAASSPNAASGQLDVMERKADCRARNQRYLDSLACFAPYRHGTILDPEAFNHCQVVKQPTDCSLDEM